MTNGVSSEVRIYIDHWEDYESIGDKAMLLNAMRRIELHLGPCQFIGPLSMDKAREFSYPNLKTVVPPHAEVVGLAKRLQSFYSKIRRLLPARFVPKMKSTDFLDGAIAIVSFKWILYRAGFHFVFSKSFQTFLQEIKNCDVFFTVGDCSLSDYWLDGVVLKSWLLRLVRPYVSFSVMSSQGIGPLATPWARRRLVGALRTLDILSFRDFSNSKALVEAEGLSGVPNRIVADEAFSYPVAGRAEVWKILESVGVCAGEPFIIVNFRNTDFTQNTNFLLSKIADLLDRVILTTKKKIVFIPMSKGDNYGRDYEAGISLKSAMSQSDRFYVMEPIDDIELVKGIIGAAVYSIGISYHLHVFSLSQGHPTLVVYTGDYYRAKSDGLISFYGPPNRTANLLEMDVEQILEYVLEIEENYTDVCAHNSDVNKAIMEFNDWTIKTLKSLLIENGILNSGQDN